MKKTMVAVLAAFATAAFGLSAHAATINQVIVRQQWPWSTDVKVEYQLEGVDASHPVDLAVTAYNGDTPLSTANLASSITGDLYGITEEFGEFYIDPIAAFGSERIAMTKFKVKLAISDSAANINEVIYKVFCLTNATCTDITKREILNGKYGSYETDYSKFGSGFTTPCEEVVVWTAVTNDLKYMTTHLVMRKIPATNQVWQVGQDSSAYVKLTENFFMGVFPVTVEQHRLINGGAMTTELTEDMALPKGDMAIFNVRGTRTPGASPARNTLGRETGEVIFWPTNSYLHDVVDAYALGKLRTKFNIDFDLPSSAQWEVACRAGSTSDLYNGKSASASNVEPLGWTSENSGSSLKRVGLKAPNPYGLYDLYGNVFELTPCLDSWGDQPGKGTSAEDPYVDPIGKMGEYNVVKRGGSYNNGYTHATSHASNQWFGWYDPKPEQGYRVVVPADATKWNQ